MFLQETRGLLELGKDGVLQLGEGRGQGAAASYDHDRLRSRGHYQTLGGGKAGELCN